MDIEKEISYIYSYIKYSFFPVEELKNEKFLIDISRRIKNNMPNSNFCSGDYNFYINNYVSQELRQRKSKSFEELDSIRNHVYLLINYCKIYDRKEIDNYEVILNEVVRYVYDNVKYEDIIEGKMDEEIENLINRGITSTFIPSEKIDNISLDISNIGFYDDKLIDYREYIERYVTSYLLKNTNLFKYDADINYLSELITTDLCLNKLNYIEILSGKHDDKIDDYIRKSMYNIKLDNNFRSVQVQVSKYVLSDNTYMNIGNEDKKISQEIFKLSRFLLEKEYNVNDIKEGKCDELIKNHIRLDSIKTNSKICEEKLNGKNPNKFFLNSKKKVLSEKVKASLLAVVVTLLSTTMTACGNIESNNFDNYEYKTIPYQMSDEFANAIDHIINYYPEYLTYDSTYIQIPLFKTYESIKGTEKEKTYAMDTMIQLIKSRAKNIDNLRGLYEELENYNTYTEYVYSKIENKLNDKHEKAVKEYDREFANYKELSPYNLIGKDKQKAIDDMMDKYSKYINSLEKELNKESRVK